MTHAAVAALLVIAAATVVTRTAAKEVLPPHAYFNRTIYPAVIDYAATERGYPQLAIGLVSDVQYAEREEIGRRHFKLSLGKLKHAVSEFNANRSHLDMVVHLGDLVDSDMDKWLPSLQPVLDQLKFPLYQVLGNHDFLGTAESAFDSVHKKLKMPARYYSLDAGKGKSYRLVVLDGNDLALYSTVAGSAKRKEADAILKTLRNRRAKNAKPFNGALGSQQIEWMKQQFQEACDQGQRVLVLIHHPMKPKDEPTNLWNDVTVVPIITSYHCVAAVLNGHAHKFLYDYHYTRFRHVHFVTFGGMVQSPFTTFGFADVYADELHIHGLIFGREVDLRYNLSYHSPPPEVGPTGRPTVNSAPSGAAVVTTLQHVLEDPHASPDAVQRTMRGKGALQPAQADLAVTFAASWRVSAAITLATVLLVLATVARVLRRV